MNFKEAYKHWNQSIVPDEKQTAKLLRNAGKQKKQMIFLRYRTAAAILAACMILFCSVPVLAAHVEPIYQLMYLVSPKMAQFFMPVQMSSEDQGIRMEVVSAYIHEDTAEIYITMEDLTGDRIDETTDLYDSYDIHRPFDSIGTCQKVGYDETTGKVTFLITIQERADGWNPSKIQGNKITFSVKELLSHKSYFKDQPVPVDLSAADTDCDTTDVQIHGLGGNYENYIPSLDEGTSQFDALVPGHPIEAFPIDGIDFTGIGYVDGKLHLQTSIKHQLQKDNHGYFYLVDMEGNKVFYSYSFTFWDSEENPDRTVFEEFVFDIPTEKLPDYTLYGYFVTSGLNTKGNWQVTFPLE